jgi:hypothetical protein
LDFNQNKDVFDSSGEMVASLHGLEMKATQNGIIVIDTAKAIGEIQGAKLKQEIYPKMLSGYFDFSPAGQIVKIDGDLPFIDYWTHELKLRIGFFDITFPEHSLADGGTWTENLIVNDFNGLKFGDDGLIETNVYSCKLNSNFTNNVVISIDCSVASNWKDIMGTLEQLGQSTTLNISEFDHNSSSKIQFDSMRGCILTFSETGTLHISMDMLIQGNSVNMTVDSQKDTEIELLPSD